MEVTSIHAHDSQVLPRLLTQISGKVSQVSGDGAYDTKACYESIGESGAKAAIPPRGNAKRMRGDDAHDPLFLVCSQWMYTTELGGECRVSL